MESERKVRAERDKGFELKNKPEPNIKGRAMSKGKIGLLLHVYIDLQTSTNTSTS